MWRRARVELARGAGSFGTLWTMSGVLIFVLCSQQPLEQDPPGSIVAELFLKDPSGLSMDSAYEEQEAGGGRHQGGGFCRVQARNELGRFVHSGLLVEPLGTPN